ncbi:hypothetical protein [Longispora urticae]
MGASMWNYYVPFQADVPAALEALRHRVFAEHDYYWWPDTRPDSIAELWAHEHFEAAGTHSILDIEEIGAAGARDERGRLLPLSAEEAAPVFGTGELTRAAFDEVFERDAVIDVEFPRWSGRYAVLYRDGHPHELVFWGYSGD